jgi:hypothetical protein
MIVLVGAINKMDPDGIHFAPGKFNPGIPFSIYLDLSGPDIDKFKKELESGWYKPWNGILALPTPKKLPGRINYKIHNYCAGCKIKYGKDVYRCKKCNSRVRTKAWASNYSRKKRNGKL